MNKSTLIFALGTVAFLQGYPADHNHAQANIPINVPTAVQPNFDPTSEPIQLSAESQAIIDGINQEVCNGREKMPSYGWENGVGGQLPKCWPYWTEDQQNTWLGLHS